MAFFRAINAVRLDMLDLLGIPYLTDLILSTLHNRNRAEYYRIYTATCLYGIASALGVKYEPYKPDLPPQPVDNRTGEEIAADRLASFGIQVVK